ncbi:MAG: Mrp/NBP35 family ATP-binding protein [Clostridia bacterium]|nr:Mrp/NBP35 family ATP-binding protein [Clostridia bacterium]
MAVSHSCGGDCGSCQEQCSSRQPESLIEPTGDYNHIRHVLAVVSGKGGVGKSMVTSLLAVALRRQGYSVGILDADITGPSVPKSFGVKSRAMQSEIGILPAETETGIKIISVNMMLESAEAPVIWRGPVIAGAVKQFWHDVVWGDLDYLLIDCPPGTGDVPLTIFQSIPLDAAIVVTSPQDLVSLIVKKAVNMANMMNIPVLGTVENMSYFRCPDCGKEHRIFGDTSADPAETGIPLLGRLPIDPDLARMIDNGAIEKVRDGFLDDAVGLIAEKFPVTAE